MTRIRTFASVCTSLLIAAAFAAPFSSQVPSAASPSLTPYAVSGAGFCVTSDGGACTLAAAATTDRAGNANGAFVLSFGSPRTHLIMAVKTGVVEATALGVRASFDGSASLEHEATHVVQQDQRAALMIDDQGAMAVTFGDDTVMGVLTLGGVGIRELPSGRTLRHELGHYIGIPGTEGGTAVGFGFVTMDDGIEGTPDIAGLFRDTAEGETGRVHGHLDDFKKVGDPATNWPVGFEARGSAICLFDDGRQESGGIRLDVNLAAALLDFRAPRCGFRAVLPVRELHCPQPCRATTIIGPAR